MFEGTGARPRTRHYSARPSWPTPPLTDIDRARLQIAYGRMEVETIAARAAAGVPEAVESLPRHKADLEAMALELHTLEGTVSTIERRDETITNWRAKIGPLRLTLATLEADAPKLPASFVAAETARLREEIQLADRQGREAFRIYLREAATAAATLRAKAETDGDQSRAVADELAAARMARSATSKAAAEDLVAHARRLIAAGQPAGARSYVLALEQLDTKPAGLAQLRAEYQVAMDEADPTLRQAAAVERTAREAAVTFEVERSRFLADVGLGADASGEAGRGTGEQLAMASIRAKTIAFAADPEHYSEPAPTGPRIDGSPEPKAPAQPPIG